MSHLRQYIPEFLRALYEKAREAKTLRGRRRTRPTLLLLRGGGSSCMSLLPMLLHLLLLLESSGARWMSAGNLLQLSLHPVITTTLEVYKLHLEFRHGTLENLSVRRELVQVHLITAREQCPASGIFTRDFPPPYGADVWQGSDLVDFSAALQWCPTGGEVKVALCAHVVPVGVLAVPVEADCGFEVCVPAGAVVVLADVVEVCFVSGFVGEAGCTGYAAIERL
ncbi:hypothetical protein HOY80DRAFT_1055768 [Tuber brumale]|nr:hypothetical protein HOY80DRAFT_1055768 [Tuber brumale]